MNDIPYLKLEARKLLDEVNLYYEISAKGVTKYNSPYDGESISFKKRVKALRQKILSASSAQDNL